MSQATSVLEHPVITGLRGAVTGLDPAAVTLTWQLSDTEVETGLAGLLDLEARAAALRGALLREAETRELTARTRAISVERWLGDRFRLSRADAADRVREAALLARHPQVQTALAQGSVTVEQATVTATALDQVTLLPGLAEGDRAEAAAFLLDQCPALAPRDLARAGQAVLEALTHAPSVDDPADQAALERDHQRAEQQAQSGERNDLRLTRRRGRLQALLDLGPLGEATLLAWLRRVEQPRPGTDGFEDQRGLSERRGDALLDLLAAAATGTLPTQPAQPTGAGDRPHQDRLDLVDHDHDDRDDHDDSDDSDDLDDSVDAAPTDPTRPISPLALIALTTTLAELRAGLAGAGRLDTGATLSAATLRELACDALIVPAVLGGPSQVLDLGRTTRVWNLAQRRAVALRDRGCAAPGCDQPPAACHLHHSWHWTDGGPTDLANAALLCGFHHRMVHRQGWAITLAANGLPQLIPPASIDPDQRPRQHHRYRLGRLTLVTGRHRT